MVTLQALKAKIEKLTRQAEAIAKRERSGAVQRVLKLMQRHGVTVADLAGLKGPKRGGGVAGKVAGVAKYRDPSTGKTWTGHGRAPEWITGASNRDDFLIDKSSAQPASATPAKKAAKTTAKAATGGPAKRARKTPAKAAKAVKAAKPRKTTAAKNGAAHGASA